MLQSNNARTLRTPSAAGTLQLSDITAQASRLPAYAGHEQIWLGRDEARGLQAIVAIHNTALGPALGGTRVWPHESFEAALTDALRLSEGMTYKSAIAGMPFGGGKAVIIADPRTEKTKDLLDAYADMLLALNGQYFTGEDVGLTLADADYLRSHTPNVTGTSEGGSGNPSPVTAYGTFLGIKAALEHRLGNGSPKGLRIAVQGLGSVGMALCEHLQGEGAKLVVADIDGERAALAAERFRAEVVDGDAILETKADVLAPCALGGVLSEHTIPRLRVRIVAGAANNQLLDEEQDAEGLRARGILYAPDYVINGGGLINVASELAPGGYDRAAAMAKVERIPGTLRDIFQRAERDGRTTSAVAAELAAERIAAGAQNH